MKNRKFGQKIENFSDLMLLIGLNPGHPDFGHFRISNNYCLFYFQVNYLSHFYLTHLLKSSLVKSTMKKIVIVSGEAHRFASIDQNTDLKPHLVIVAF